LHAVIDGIPFVEPPVAMLVDPQHAAHTAFLLAVAERAPPQPHSRGPPLNLL
jgi:hypothetical protein